MSDAPGERDDGPGAAPPDETFGQALTLAQSRMYAFIVSLIGRTAPAQDLLQETNLELWRKAAHYDRSRPFLPWALGFARTQVLAWRRRQATSHLVFDDALFTVMLEDQEQQPAPEVLELEALETCLDRLGAGQRELLERCYAQGEAVQAVARDLGRSINGLSVTLHRLRQVLLDCIRGRLAREGG